MRQFLSSPDQWAGLVMIVWKSEVKPCSYMRELVSTPQSKIFVRTDFEYGIDVDLVRVRNADERGVRRPGL